VPQTPLPTFIPVRQANDSGAQTADRYDWQAAMAVVDAMALAASFWNPATQALTTPLTIVCEFHEDYLLTWDGKVELASVKHRDRGQPAWTIASFLDDGGLTHLFLSWIQLQRECSTVLVSTTPAASGNPRRLHDLVVRLRLDDSLLDDAETSTLSIFSSALFSRIPDGLALAEWKDEDAPSTVFQDTVLDFLKSLTIDCDRSDRHELPFAAAARYVEPFLVKIGVSPSLAPEVWKRSTELVAERMRDKGLGELGGLQMVADRFQPGGAEALIRQLASRTFTGEELLEIVQVCAALNLEPSTTTDRMATTKLAAKLINGGCSPTTVRAAERHAELFREFEVKLVADDTPGAYSDLANIRDWALLRAGYAHDAALTADVPGRAMWKSLPDMIDVPAELTTLSVTKEILIGAVCALASECKVWFSEEFDMDAALTALPAPLPISRGIA